MQDRRRFLTGAATTAGITLLPFRVAAGQALTDTFATAQGTLSVTPIRHASFVIQSDSGTIYVDPVGGKGLYQDMPPADLIVITHEHRDHFDQATLDGIVTPATGLVANPAVFAKMTPVFQELTTAIANGDSTAFGSIRINAIPAYNTTADRLDFHPQGRDNGYVLGVEGLRIYVSGDSEDIPEMRALKDIDIAFVCMNLPFTMDIAAAASAVTAFAPTYVYPYHYRGRDGGTQDPAAFAALLDGGTTTKLVDWYS